MVPIIRSNCVNLFQVDIMIPMHIKDILNSTFSVLGTLFVICYASPIIIAFVIPMIGLFIFLQSSYLSASRYSTVHNSFQFNCTGVGC